MFSSLEGKTDMITPKQSQHKQKVVIEFLLLEGENSSEHKQMAKANAW